MPVPRATGDALADAGLLMGRLLLVFIFLHEGSSILGNYAGTAAYMQKSGVPSLLLPLVVALQLGGDRCRNHDAFGGARVCCVLCAYRDPVPRAVRRSQSVAAFPEGSGYRGRIPRSRLLWAGKLVDWPLLRAVGKRATSRPARSLPRPFPRSSRSACWYCPR